MRVDPNVSDLFFNHDVSACANHDALGDFTGYDDAKMLYEAQSVIDCLDRLNVSVPSARELVDDFYARV